MFDRVKKVILNNMYLSIFYLIISLLMPTMFNNIFINYALKGILVWGIIVAVYNVFFVIRDRISKVEIIILIFLLVTLILNLCVYNNMENIKCWLVNFILMIGIFKYQRNKTFKEIEDEMIFISRITVAITSILSISSIILYFVDRNRAFSSEGTFQGVFNYNNSLAICAGIALILSIYCFFSTNTKYRYIYLTNIVFELIIVILTEGRSVYFLFISVVFLYIYIKIRNVILRRALFATGVVGLIVIFIEFLDKLYSFFSARTELWISSFMVIKNNLLFGVGNYNLVNCVKSIRKDVVLPGIESGGVHNIFIQIFTTNGIIAFGIYVVLMCLIFAKLTNIIQKRNDYKLFILASMMWGILFINIFESNIMYITSFISVIFWMYLGRIISLEKGEKIKE